VRYAIAWNLEREQKLDEAARAYIDVQANAPPRLAADASFALGNVYFAQGIRRTREAATMDGPQPELAELGLARDAYRSALRLDPQLYGARYNLELLERMVPRRPEEGWRRNTDPVKLQADRHTGWTTIRETKKRGLP
jgi:mxaK protein